MKKESIHYLNILSNGIYIDGTFGCGGHSKEILNKLNSKGILYVFDKDLNSINLAKNFNDNRIIYKHSSFSNIKNILIKDNKIGKVNGILLDLGLSNLQIFESKRGFTFKNNEILDMRMDTTKGIPAFELLKKLKPKEIENIFKNFGEEYKYSKKISKLIFDINKKKTIKYTNQLFEIINLVHKKKNKINILTKYFQAIRIYTNNELNDIKKILTDSVYILKKKGRLVIISFNSLETKIIKKIFNNKNENLLNIPITYKEEKLFINKYYFKKIIKLKPSYEEIKNNRKSRSAIMNVYEKL